MNVYKNKIKLFSLILISILSLNISYSFNICGTSIDHPWFAVKDNGVEVLIVDKDGDTYFRGEDHTLNNQGSEKSFAVGSSNFFNKVTSKFNSNQVYEKQASLPSTKSLIIKNNLGVNVAKFTKDDKIYSKGTTVYEGSNAGCMSDGNYCNADGVTIEYRDYYCDITADKTGACKNTPSIIENCATKLSTDTDGGINKNNKGTVTDYTSCSGASCLFNSYSDSCTSTYNLKEYYNTGSGHSSTNINCGDDNVKYCKSQSEIWTTDFRCGLDKCSRSTDKFVQTCGTTSTNLGTWVCDNDFSRSRVNTVYSPTCSDDGSGSTSCGESSSSVGESETAPVGYYCNNGNWAVIKDCDGYWNLNSGSCSVSCGGGNYDKQWITTQNPTPGGTACPSPSWYNNAGNSCNTQSCPINCQGYWNLNSGSCSVSCGGGNYDKQWVTTTSPANGGTACPSPSWYNNAGNSCNTQACCTSHSYYACGSYGDVWWFNSCNVQEDSYTSCDQKCMDTGHNSYRCVECLTTSDCGTNYICDDGNCIINP